MPTGQHRGCDAQLARDGFQVFPAQQPQHRCTLALARHPASTPERHCARPLRPLCLARARSNLVRLIVHGSPLLRISSACEVSQSTVLRGNSAQMQGASLNNAQLQGASLYGAELQGALLDFAQLQGASLQNVVTWRLRARAKL